MCNRILGHTKYFYIWPQNETPDWDWRIMAGNGEVHKMWFMHWSYEIRHQGL